MDDPSSTGSFIILVMLIILSGFFSGAETALMSVSKIRIHQLVEEGKRKAAIVQEITAKPDKLLGTILVGNNLVNVAASALATGLAIELFGRAGIGIATGVMTLGILIFGEITPKTLAAYASEQFSLFVAKPLKVLMVALNPIVMVLNAITHVLLFPFGNLKIKHANKPFATEEEIKTMIDVSHQKGEIDEQESEMIKGVFEFDDTKLKAIMTPRVDIFAIPHDVSIEGAIKTAISNPYSRIPVYKDVIDNIIGMVHIRELMKAASDGENDIIEVIRPLPFVPSTRRASTLFAQLRADKTHMAVVLDEFGGVAGLITMEDLVEEIVGDISDEYDPEESTVLDIGDDTVVVDGDMELDDIEKELDLIITVQDIETIGGFLFDLFGRVPKDGETVRYGEHAFTVNKMENNRISQVKIVNVAREKQIKSEEERGTSSSIRKNKVFTA